MLVSMGVTVILKCIVIGSTTAYAVFLSLTNTGLLSSYVICIACESNVYVYRLHEHCTEWYVGILQKRLCGEPFPPSRFNLGNIGGNVINILALAFLVVSWVFQFFPSAPEPTAVSINWSVVIYGAVILFFGIYYFVRDRHRYTGPVVQVRKGI